MKIDYLEWDSQFFCKRIGRLSTVMPISEWSELLQKVQQSYDMIYIFSSQRLNLDGVHPVPVLVDEKKAYSMSSIEGGVTKVSQVKLYEGKTMTPRLEELAWVSAGHSRYKVDERFGEAWKAMYSHWMENSLNGVMADKVLVYKENSQIMGVLTLKFHEDYANIGLVAVHPDVQARGVGSALMQTAKTYVQEQGYQRMEVVTQQANQQACRYY